MLKNVSVKINLLLSVLMFAGILVAPLFIASEPAYAAKVTCDSTDGEAKEICEASIKASACGDSDSAKAKACRKGFREGFRDPDKKASEICDGYDGEEMDSCRQGVIKGGKAADAKDGLGGSFTYNTSKGQYWCGNLRDDKGNFDKESNFQTKFNFGCVGEKGPANLNPILDLVFAFVRFLSVGVGIIIIIALIMSGIQYSGSEGNPEASAKAKKRAQNALIGLIIYMFAWSILQFIIPGGVFK